MEGPDGALYGTAFYGGTEGDGTVFKLASNGGVLWTVSCHGADGAHPQAGLTLAADGNLYGTTQNGGAYTNQFGTGYGTIFTVTPDGSLTTLFSCGGTNGAFPRAGLLEFAPGVFYGTTAYGGPTDNGAVFRFTTVPSAPPPVIQSITQNGNKLDLTWSSVPGRRYQAFYTSSLDQANWTSLGPIVTATSPATTASDTPGSDPSRFYRVGLLP